MADVKPKRGNQYRFVVDFTFDDKDIEKLARIGITDKKLISKIERDAASFMAAGIIQKQGPKSAQTKAALMSLEKSAEGMLEALDIDPLAKVLITVRAAAAGYDNNSAFLYQFREDVKRLRDMAHLANAKYTPTKGSPEHAGRESFALSLARKLQESGIKPTTYDQGPYYQCLKICLQSVGDIPADNDYDQYEPNIKDLVGWAVKELPSRAL